MSETTENADVDSIIARLLEGRIGGGEEKGLWL